MISYFNSWTLLKDLTFHFLPISSQVGSDHPTEVEPPQPTLQDCRSRHASHMEGPESTDWQRWFKLPATATIVEDTS